MPPVGEITEKTEEDSPSNRRPIALIGSPACQRSAGMAGNDTLNSGSGDDKV